MLPQWGSVTRRSVRRSHPDVYLFVAAAATDATTMSRPPYRGGRSRGRGRRGFSDRPYNGGGRGELVSGDSHFRSVREANLGLTEGVQGGSFTNQRPHLSQRPPPPHYGSQQFRSPPPRPFDRSQPFRPSAQQPFDRNQAIQRRPQPYPRPPKALNYRTWEFAEMAPPPNCEKFVVLSYNILADYLAMSHRPKLYSHVPWHMLNWEWRKSNIIFELGLWSADVMCFQEVDRFQELEEGFKLWGYRGIWKMRTGNAVDGCAIFWRTSRFKLVHEECIEFNKLSLRDNVAQICVFELLRRNYTGNVASPPTSSAGSNRVVVCNIHVLYNPKRGDFKLGQVRMLLDRAHALSKIWNNAPVVLCGDFNCTPKSPLYNFILEQKLDLSGVDRDKVSGQASVEIRAPKRYNRLNSGTQPADSSPQTPLSEDCKEVDVKLTDYLSNVQNENSNLDMLNLPSINNLFQPQCTEAALDVFNKSSTDMQCGNKVGASCDVKEETAQHELDNSKGETGATFFVPIGGSQESTSCVTSEDGFPIDKMNDEIHTLAPLLTSPFKDDLSDLAEMGQRVKDEATFHSKHGSSSDDCSARAKFNPESLKDCNSEVSSQEVFCQTTMCDAVEASHTGSTEILLSHSNVNDDNCSSSATYRISTSRGSSEVDFLLDKKLENLYLKEPDAAMMEAEGVTEDDKNFLSALHDNEDAFPLDSGQSGRLNFDHSPNEFASDQYKPRLKSPSDEVLDDFSLGLDSEATNLEKTGYDPSLWTPMEIATATGNPESMLMEHFLQLKSTYAEVEDCSKTRDSNGEPLVTSYNRCFMGTVDYIWRSEGLQTVKVLAPIPKDAMEWTPGFPTKKWGSDHIALAAELAFIEAPEMR